MSLGGMADYQVTFTAMPQLCPQKTLAVSEGNYLVFRNAHRGRHSAERGAKLRRRLPAVNSSVKLATFRFPHLKLDLRLSLSFLLLKELDRVRQYSAMGATCLVSVN